MRPRSECWQMTTMLYWAFVWTAVCYFITMFAGIAGLWLLLVCMLLKWIIGWVRLGRDTGATRWQKRI
jgi:hypothetical protein